MPLVDTFGRLHDNLRISVTDRCNIRCYYCMPEDRAVRAREEILTFEEMERFVRIAARLGVDKIRITGGEPLVRKRSARLDRADLALSRAFGISRLTTNGVLLAPQAESLYEAGLRRINIHLDTLDRERFEKITRRDEFGRVMAGIDECRRLGFIRQDQRRCIERCERGRHRSSGALRTRARDRDPLHRIHAARLAGILGSRARC